MGHDARRWRAVTADRELQQMCECGGTAERDGEEQQGPDGAAHHHVREPHAGDQPREPGRAAEMGDGTHHAGEPGDAVVDHEPLDRGVEPRERHR